jgi:hypothetical protein
MAVATIFYERLASTLRSFASIALFFNCQPSSIYTVLWRAKRAR